jgi:hypothetical protein
MDSQSNVDNLWLQCNSWIFVNPPPFVQQSTKILLRVKLQEEIGRFGVIGSPTGPTFHFPFLGIFSPIFIFYLI